jgi:hypothetical protein
VAWSFNATYGTCTPEGFEGGCGPPLEIQSGPEYDRNFSSYGVVKPARALRPRKSFFLSGSHKIPTARLNMGASGRGLRCIRVRRP